jgi:hypothetical protein
MQIHDMEVGQSVEVPNATVKQGLRGTSWARCKASSCRRFAVTKSGSGVIIERLPDRELVTDAIKKGGEKIFVRQCVETARQAIRRAIRAGELSGFWHVEPSGSGSMLQRMESQADVDKAAADYRRWKKARR